MKINTEILNGTDEVIHIQEANLILSSIYFKQIDRFLCYISFIPDQIGIALDFKQYQYLKSQVKQLTEVNS